jgi:hypothetical protein
MWDLIDEKLAEHMGLQEGEALQQYSELIILGRGEEPEDVAAFVSCLASQDSDYMTGQSVMIDGASFSRSMQSLWTLTGVPATDIVTVRTKRSGKGDFMRRLPARESQAIRLRSMLTGRWAAADYRTERVSTNPGEGSHDAGVRDG